jgi:VanZ family protein
MTADLWHGATRWLQRRPWLHLWLPPLAWMALIFVLSAQPDLPHPSSGWLDLLLSSGAHVLLFGALAFLWARAVDHRAPLWVPLVATLLYAASDEFHQVFVPGRHADPWDLVCDALGALAGLLLWRWWSGRAGGRTRLPGSE